MITININDENFVRNFIKNSELAQVILNTKIIGIVNQNTFNKLRNNETLKQGYDFCIYGIKIQVDNDCLDDIITFIERNDIK